MFHSNKRRITNFRAEYAKQADFCGIFKQDMKPLYLLAFLLTANHKEAEQCFSSTLDEGLKEQAVFKEKAGSWVKRRLIENAIKFVSPVSTREGQKRDRWSVAQRETHGEWEIDTVTKLAPFERFVFVMSILERYSNWDCSLLLGCGANEVVQARVRALHRLPDLAALVPRRDGAELLAPLDFTIRKGQSRTLARSLTRRVAL